MFPQLARYDWPNHLWALEERIVGHAVGVASTALARVQLAAHGVRAIGPGLSVSGRLVLRCRRNDSIRLGENVALVSRFRSNLVGLTNPIVLDTAMGGLIELGDHCGLSSVVLSSRSRITLGRHTKVGGNTRIFDHDFHSVDFLARRDPHVDAAGVRTAEVCIEDDCFVGTNVIILKGTSIGARSIVAAGAVVFGLRAPPDSLIGGNPARVLKSLNHPSESRAASH